MEPILNHDLLVGISYNIYLIQGEEMSLRIENLIEYPDVHIFLGTATISMICIDLQHLIVRLDHHNKL